MTKTIILIGAFATLGALAFSTTTAGSAGAAGYWLLGKVPGMRQYAAWARRR